MMRTASRSSLRNRVAVAAGFLLMVSVARIAEAGEIEPFNGDNVTIPAGAPGTTSGPADPYPSPITLDWCPGTIQDVNVSFNFLAHGSTADLDILLVGPGGQTALIASDSGNTDDVTDLFIDFDDEAASTPPAPWVSGAYRLHDVSAGADAFPPPAPAGPYGSSLSVFDGTNPNGTWNLFVDDDSPTESGEFSSWVLLIQTSTPTAPTSTGVCINHEGPGDPYRTSVTTSGLASPVQDVNVTLNGLRHTWPDDLDILLSGPGARNTMLMSDAGGGTSIAGVDVTLDDEATGLLPDEETPPISPGAYKPSNHEDAEDLPAPAPPTQGTGLSTFDGLDPNGTWTLFLTDDTSGDFGVLNSWSLQLTTPSYAISPAKAKEGKRATFTVTRTGDLGQAVSATIATAPGSAKPKDFKALAGTLSFAAGDATEQVVVKTKNDNKDEKKNEKFSLNLTSGQATFTGTGKVTDTDK